MSSTGLPATFLEGLIVTAFLFVFTAAGLFALGDSATGRAMSVESRSALRSAGALLGILAFLLLLATIWVAVVTL